MTPKKPDDLTAQAIRGAMMSYVPKRCGSAESISKLMTTLAHSAGLFHAENPTQEEDFLLQTYLRQATSYEDLIKRADFQEFKQALESAWFGRQYSHIQPEAVGQLTPSILNDLRAWQSSNSASVEDCLTYLTIQKVAVSAASAEADREAGYISEDYDITGQGLFGGLDHDAIIAIQNRYFLLQIRCSTRKRSNARSQPHRAEDRVGGLSVSLPTRETSSERGLQTLQCAQEAFETKSSASAASALQSCRSDGTINTESTNSLAHTCSLLPVFLQPRTYAFSWREGQNIAHRLVGKSRTHHPVCNERRIRLPAGRPRRKGSGKPRRSVVLLRQRVL
ncbi:MAG: hypothetical protein GY892_24125 [Shimia sp.]|nr:hypothetical protein [Shimia sp.]